MTIGDRIKIKRKAKDLTLEELATIVHLSRQTLSRYETGVISNIPSDTIELLAKALNTTPAYLMGWENTPAPADPFENVKLVAFPIVGSIAAGYNGLAVEEYTGEYEYIPASELHAPQSEYFVLRVSGDSMYPALLDGDRVLVRRKTSVDSGRIAIVLYNDEEATIKKVHYVQGEDWLELVPINPEYKTKRIENEDLEHCQVLGEVVELMRKM